MSKTYYSLEGIVDVKDAIALKSKGLLSKYDIALMKYNEFKDYIQESDIRIINRMQSKYYNIDVRLFTKMESIYILSNRLNSYACAIMLGSTIKLEALEALYFSTPNDYDRYFVSLTIMSFNGINSSRFRTKDGDDSNNSIPDYMKVSLEHFKYEVNNNREIITITNDPLMRNLDRAALDFSVSMFKLGNVYKYVPKLISMHDNVIEMEYIQGTTLNDVQFNKEINILEQKFNEVGLSSEYLTKDDVIYDSDNNLWVVNFLLCRTMDTDTINYACQTV